MSKESKASSPRLMDDLSVIVLNFNFEPVMSLFLVCIFVLNVYCCFFLDRSWSGFFYYLKKIILPPDVFFILVIARYTCRAQRASETFSVGFSYIRHYMASMTCSSILNFAQLTVPFITDRDSARIKLRSNEPLKSALS